MTLPAIGQCSLPRLTEAIGGAATLTGLEIGMRCRTVCVRHSTLGWLNFGTVLTVGLASTNDAAEDDIDLGEVRLLGKVLPYDEAGSVDGLAAVLANWRVKLGAPRGFAFSNVVNVRRYGSHAQHTSPCWVFDLSEETPDKGSYGVPQGPFYCDMPRVFGESVGQIAASWLEQPRIAGNSTVAHSYQVVLMDRRAVIAALEATAYDLSIRVDALAPAPPLRCCATRTGFHGDSETLIEPIISDMATIHFTGPVQRLAIWLVTADGQLLDEYYEDATRVSWGSSVYNRPRTEHDEPYAALDHALASGESESVEFKEWIAAATRDTKTYELLKTVVAFANTSGGDTYIGVSDAAELVGTTAYLRRDYGPRRESLPHSEAYVRDLRRLLSEGVRPYPQCTFEWINKVGLVVLRIRTAAGTDKPYTIIESGDTYVRRGATNRKARAEELRLLFTNRSVR